MSDTQRQDGEAGSPRLIWADAAKGSAMIMVVLFHVFTKDFLQHGWEIPTWLLYFGLGVSSILEPIVIPLFFAVSGYFASKHLHLPWRVVAARRIFPLYVGYVIWYLIHSAFFALIYPEFGTAQADGPAEFALGLIWGYTSLWYIYALAAYVALGWLFRNRPWLGLGLAVLAAALSNLAFQDPFHNSDEVIRHAVFFLFGAYHPGLLSAEPWAQRSTPLWRATLVVVPLLLSAVLTAESIGVLPALPSSLPAETLLVLLRLVVSGLGIIAGTIVARWVVRRIPRVAAYLSHLGRNTLPIYVLHLLLLAVLNSIMDGFQLAPALRIAYPWVAAALLLHSAILIWRGGILLGSGLRRRAGTRRVAERR